MTDQREDFEEAAARMGYNLTMAKHETGEYHYPVTQDAWNIWQECWDKAACAQDDSEPVAWQDPDTKSVIGAALYSGAPASVKSGYTQPLYTHPPAAKVPDWTNRLNTCKHHGDDHEACAVYGGQVPCDAEGGEAVFVTGEPLYIRLAKDFSGGPDETFVEIEDGNGKGVRIQRFEDGNDWLIGPVYEAPKSSQPDRAQGDAEPVGVVRRNDMGQTYIAKLDDTAFHPAKHVGALIYDRPPAAKVPKGWKLVPCHADKAMIRIGKRAQKEEFLFRQDPDLNIQQIWKAMIAFAPTPPEQESE